MAGNSIVFGVEQIGRLFPFYILVNRDFMVRSAGDTVNRMFGVQSGQSITEYFTIQTPNVADAQFADLGGISYQLIAATANPGEFPMIIQGELEYLAATDELLFLGAPSISVKQDNTLTGGLSDNNDNLFDIPTQPGTHTSFKHNIPNVDIENYHSDNIRGVVITDARGAIEWVSRDFERSIGCKLEEVIGLRPRDVIYGKQSTYIPSSYVDDMVKKKKPFSFDNIGYNKFNTSFWFRTTVQPILGQQNEVKGRYYFFEDVTELKTNEHALRESQELWKFALEGAGDGIWSYDIPNHRLQVSFKFKELLGYNNWDTFDVEELQKVLLTDDYLQLMQQIIPKLDNQSPSFSLEQRMTTLKHNDKYFKIRGKVLNWTPEGEPNILFGTLTDINDDKLKDLEFRKMATRQSTILESLNSAVLLENENREIVLVNQRFCDMFSVPISTEQMLGLDCSGMAENSKVLFDNPEDFLSRVNELLQKKIMVTGDLLFLQDGRILERDYIPIIIDGLYAGHLWKYNDVTQPKKLEQQLKDSEARLSALINNFNAAVLFEDINRNIIFVNKALYRIIEAPSPDFSLVGANSADSLEYVKHLFRYPEEELSRINEIVANRSLVASKQIEMADGKILKQQFIPVVVDSKESGFLWIYEDVTESFNHEKKITEQREYFQRILNELPADVMMFNLQQKFEFINKNAVRNDEMREWLIGKDMYDYCARKGIDNSRAVQRDRMFREVVTTHKALSNIDKHTLPDGSEKFMLRFLYPFLDNDGNPEYVVGFGMDVTDQIFTEKKIAEQREYYHEILNEVPADIVIFSLDHRYQFINKNAVKDPDMRAWMIGKNDYEYCDYKGLDHKLADERSQIFKKTQEYKQPSSIIDHISKADGTFAHILRIMYPSLDANNEVKFIIGYGIDITEQIENKYKAEIQEARVLKLLNLVKDGIFTGLADGSISFFNNSFARILELDTNSTGVNFLNLLSQTEQQKFVISVENLDITGLPQSCILHTTTISGKDVYLDFTIASSVSNIGGPYVGRISDITEVVKKEEYLTKIIAKEKELNNSKSQFIRITSHELRTPLAIIQANTEILEMFLSGSLGVNSKLKPEVMMGRIMKEVRLMTEILNELMMISRIEAGKMEFAPDNVDVLTFVQDIKNDLYNPHTDGRVLSVHCATENAIIANIDKKLMRHAIVNLINNAFKYSTGRNPPQISLKKIDNMLIFEVEDFGIGIPEEDQKKLFSSFFRASNTGVIHGSGLGLMVVDYVVKKHNGTISFSSIQNEGSTFKISLQAN
jgi:PAS domain S-box-containing protein